MTTNPWLDQLADLNPGDPIPPPPDDRTTEQQAVDHWGEEHAQLLGEQVEAMFNMQFDADYHLRRARLTELRAILRDAPEDQP